MGNYFNNFEDFIRQKFDNISIEPSAKVLRKLRFKLWKTEFFSLDFRKFNIIYTGIFISAVILFLSFHNNHSAGRSPSGEGNSTENTAIENTNESISSTQNTQNNTPNSSSDLLTDEPNILPSPAFEPDITEGCAPLNVRFKNTSANANSYKWDFGNGESSTSKNPEAIFKTAGNYEVVLEAKSEHQKTGIFKRLIRVTEPPVALAEIDKENSDIGLKLITFKNNSKSAVSCTWTFGDKSSSNEFNAIHTYKNFGIYKVNLTVYDNNGCSDTMSFENKFLHKNYELTFPVNFRPSTLGSENNGYYEKSGADKFTFYPKNNGASEYELKIIAPNGIVVFTSNNIKQGWNGYIKGRLASGGAYTYTAKGFYPNGKKFDLKGTFNVIVVDINGYY